MDVTCSNKKLMKLYETGRSSRKYRMSEGVIKRFIMRVDVLIAAEMIHDLWKHPALKFEKLKGYGNRYSLRINQQYRLEVEIEWVNEERTKGNVELIDISKHYE